MERLPDEEATADSDAAGQVEAALLRALALWATGSVAGGGALWAIGARRDQPVLRAFGRQTLLWGAVDAVIAGVGAARRGSGTNSKDLRRLLLVNAALDVGYLAGGAAMIAGRDRLAALPRYSAEQAIGDGAAIIVQGTYLLGADVAHARRLSPEATRQ